MRTTTLGKSGVRISQISFGGGPISGLLTGDNVEHQRKTVYRAVSLGVNWFDTAAKYGDGRSEASLGRALSSNDLLADVHIGTKVRLFLPDRDDIGASVRTSVEDSLARLGVDSVTLLQLHNSVTARRDDLPTSLTPADVLDKGGVVEAFEELRRAGRAEHLGMTGLGDVKSVGTVLRNGPFVSAQVPLNLLTPISGEDRFAGSIDVDPLWLLDECKTRDVGVIAIRVFAGGALAGQGPSEYTKKTKFFTLDIFERDRARAAKLCDRLPPDISLEEATVRYVLGLPGVATAAIGFADPEQVESAVRFAERGPLPRAVLECLCR